MRKRVLLLFLSGLVFPGAVLTAQSDAGSTQAAGARPRMPYRFVLADLPFNRDPGSIQTENRSPVPSMEESLSWTESVFGLGHAGIARMAEGSDLDKRSRDQTTLIAQIVYDSLLVILPIPGGTSWLHEEWHRAVLGRRGMGSYDDVYKAKPGSETISVSHVEDDDLRRLKRDHPAEMVRLMEAGMEAQAAQNIALMKRTFAFGSRGREDLVILWSNSLNNLLYLDTCGSGESDRITVQSNYMERSRVDVRDFTGLDCNAWVYDLFRPSEPYDARGQHPYGPGVDRYIKYSNGDSFRGALLNEWQYGTTRRHADLTRQEQDYLRLQYRLSFLNFVSPAMLGYSRLEGPTDSHWNASLGHHLTSFGYVIDARFFLRDEKAAWFLTLHAYRNAGMTLPGVDLELFRWKADVGGHTVYWNFGASVWLQPDDQMFWTRRKEGGGMIRIGAALPVGDRVEIFAETSYKSQGWVMGTVYLDPAAEFRSGISWVL